ARCVEAHGVGPPFPQTAGPVRIGRVARYLFGKTPDRGYISLSVSFRETYRGHGTDVSLVGGLLREDTDDSRI
ncbi:hypothetical protein ACEE46_11360, partial [Staphylococcus chromogenes]